MILPFTEILDNCAIAIIQILLYCFGGYLLAKTGKLNDSQIRGMSKISQDLLIPALTFSNFITMNPADMVTYFPIVITTVVIVFLGMCVGKFVCLYLVRESRYAMTYQVVCGFTHTLNIQLSIVEALAPFLGKIDGMMDKTYPMSTETRGAVFVMLSTIINTIIRWSLLTRLLKRKDPLSNDLPGSPAEIPIVDKKPDAVSEVIREPLWKKIWNFFNAPLFFALLSIFITTIPPLQNAFISENSILYETVTQSVNLISQASSPVLLVLLGANFGYSQAQDEKLPFKVTCGISIAKMVIMPFLGFFIILGLQKISLMTDPTMMVVVLTSFAAPTANNLLVQYANQGKETAAVSKMVLATYICSVVTIPMTLITFFVAFPFS